MRCALLCGALVKSNIGLALKYPCVLSQMSPRFESGQGCTGRRQKNGERRSLALVNWNCPAPKTCTGDGKSDGQSRFLAFATADLSAGEQTSDPKLQKLQIGTVSFCEVSLNSVSLFLLYGNFYQNFRIIFSRGRRPMMH